MHADTRVSSPWRCNKPKYAGTWQQNFKYMKQELIELKGDVHKSTVLVGYFNIPFSGINTTSKQKTTIHQLVLTDTYWTLYPK